MRIYLLGDCVLLYTVESLIESDELLLFFDAIFSWAPSFSLLGLAFVGHYRYRM